MDVEVDFKVAECARQGYGLIIFRLGVPYTHNKKVSYIISFFQCQYLLLYSDIFNLLIF